MSIAIGAVSSTEREFSDIREITETAAEARRKAIVEKPVEAKDGDEKPDTAGDTKEGGSLFSLKPKVVTGKSPEPDTPQSSKS